MGCGLSIDTFGETSWLVLCTKTCSQNLVFEALFFSQISTAQDFTSINRSHKLDQSTYN